MGMSQFDERTAIWDTFALGAGNGLDPVAVTGNRDYLTRLDGWYLSNLDTIDHDVTVGILGSFVNAPVGKVVLPALVSGEAPAVTDVLVALAGLAASGIAIPVGGELYIQVSVAATIDPAILSAALIGAF